MQLSRFATSRRTKRADGEMGSAKRSSRWPSVLLVNGDSLDADGYGGYGGFRVPGTQTVIRHIDDIAFKVTPTATRVYETLGGRDLADFDLVHVVSHPLPTGMLLSAIADHLEGRGRPMANMAGIGAPTRLMQMIRLARSGVCVPRTVYLAPQNMAESYGDLVEQLGYPFLLTRLVSHRPEGERLIGGEQEFAEGCLDPVPVVAQEHIPNRGLYRLLVMGGNVVHATSTRPSYHGIADGARPAEQLEHVQNLDPRAIQAAVEAAEAMGYETSAVLLAQHSLKRTWHVLEAHYSTNLGDGAFPALEIAAYYTYLRRHLTTRPRTHPHPRRGTLDK